MSVWERLAGWWRLALERWQALGRLQRFYIAGLAVAVLGAVGMGLALSRDGYVAVANGLSAADAATVAEKLKELQVPFRAGDDGMSILVPADQRLTAGLAVAQTGLAGSGAVGLELFDTPKFGATDFERRVNYLRAQQGELERAILRMAKVAYANVKLAIPEPSPFVREEKPVTAAVLIQARLGQALSREEVQGIASFLSRAVQGLQPEQVTVVDHLGRTLLGGVEGSGPVAVLAEEQELRRGALQKELQLRVQQLLEPLFGSGNVIAQVNLTLSLAESRVESRTVTPGAPVSVQSVRETGERTGSGPLAGDNQPAAEGPPVYQGTGALGTGAETWRVQSATQYEISERREVTASAAGGIKEISVGVAINRTGLTLEQVQQVREMVALSVGASPERVGVTVMPFSASPPPSAPVVTRPPAPEATSLWPWSPDLLAAAAGILLLLATAALVLRRRGGPTLALPGGVSLPMDEHGPAVATTGRTVATAEKEPRPQPPQSPEAILEREVADMIEQDPEPAAALLRSWLRGQ